MTHPLPAPATGPSRPAPTTVSGPVGPKPGGPTHPTPARPPTRPSGPTPQPRPRVTPAIAVRLAATLGGLVVGAGIALTSYAWTGSEVLLDAAAGALVARGCFAVAVALFRWRLAAGGAR